MWVEPSQLLCAVDPPDFPPMLAVVVHKPVIDIVIVIVIAIVIVIVHEHVLADAEEGGRVHLEGRGHCHLGAQCLEMTIW